MKSSLGLLLGMVERSMRVPADEGSIRRPLHPGTLVEGVGVRGILILGFAAVVSFFATL
ncbi:MAG: hypothetical protein VX346_08865 [Planctomycetota bacterium]|nr:hypothetical protein [Planctomycetota bacterium]